MRFDSSATDRRQETLGMVYGVAGVLAFSMSLPATRAAVPVFGGLTVGIGRAVGAAVLAAIALRLRGVPRPTSEQRRGLILVIGGVVVGFPLFSALALVHVPSSRGAVIVGLLPAATAVVAKIRGQEHPSPAFWWAAMSGLVAVLIFAAATGAGGRPEAADLLLLLAVGSAAVGYAEGGRLSRDLGGWQTISWALVLATPLTVPIAVAASLHHGLVEPTTGAVLGLVYVTVVSMFLGFFFWYAGLALGGVARVSQVQLLQPLFTFVWAALLLDETITAGALLTAVAVLVSVAFTRRAAIG